MLEKEMPSSSIRAVAVACTAWGKGVFAGREAEEVEWRSPRDEMATGHAAAGLHTDVG